VHGFPALPQVGLKDLYYSITAVERNAKPGRYKFRIGAASDAVSLMRAGDHSE
jgi:hypothetical protein